MDSDSEDSVIIEVPPAPTQLLVAVRSTQYEVRYAAVLAVSRPLITIMYIFVYYTCTQSCRLGFVPESAKIWRFYRMIRRNLSQMKYLAELDKNIADKKSYTSEIECISMGNIES